MRECSHKSLVWFFPDVSPVQIPNPLSRDPAHKRKSCHPIEQVDITIETILTGRRGPNLQVLCTRTRDIMPGGSVRFSRVFSSFEIRPYPGVEKRNCNSRAVRLVWTTVKGLFAHARDLCHHRRRGKDHKLSFSHV